MALKDEPVAYQRQQYDEKNAVLDSFGEPVSAWSLYEDIFDDLELVMPIVIIDEEETKHTVKMSIYEAVSRCAGRNDVLMGGVTFFNEFVSKATAKNIHAFIIDMDNVYSGVLQQAFLRDWRRADGTEIPLPTYIVNSGTGLHLYFVMKEPLPCYKSQMTDIDRLYRRLAEMETTGRNYLTKSVQWFGQDFRMAGGCGKIGFENTVFKVGEKWGADELGWAVGLKDVHFVHEGESRPKPKKEGKRKQYKTRKGYYLNRAVYDSSVKRCRLETHEGNRYMSMCALSVLAWKCKVSQDELERDLLSLLPDYNKNAERRMKPGEIGSAMKMYNEKAILTPRSRTEDWLGWEFKGSRRNGRKRAVHLERARAVQMIDYPAGEWRNAKGRPTAEQTVRSWRETHPDGKKADCIRDTGLSKPTVYKWWDA